MPDTEPTPAATPRPSIQFRTDRVEAPQQYTNWRDYAFSDEPASDGDART